MTMAETRIADPVAPDVAPATSARSAAPASAPISEMMRVAVEISRGVSSDEEWTAHERALVALLEAVDWSGSAQHIVEALPHVDPVDSFETISSVLERLGVDAEVAWRRRRQLDREDFPAAYETKDGVRVAASYEEFREQQRGRWFARRSLKICTVEKARPEAGILANKGQSFFALADEVAHDEIVGALTLTGLVNLLVLATPLYAMSVYALALPADAGLSLAFFTLVALAALALDDYLRLVRDKLIAQAAGRIHYTILIEGLRKRLGMSLSALERVSTAAFLAQLKRMENVLGFFQSGNVRALLDAPFVLIFLVFLGMTGGWIVVVPIVGVIAMCIVALLSPSFARREAAATEATSWRTREILRETVINSASIREAGVEGPWLDRLFQRLDREVGGSAELNEGHETSNLIGQAILAASAAATLGFGAYLSIDGQLSVGGLMAAIILNGRILSPIHALTQSFPQMRELRQDVELIEQMLAHEDELQVRGPSVHRHFTGTVQLTRVGLRFPQSSELALRNVNFKLTPGERLAIFGPGGSGRSLLSKMIVGLTKPTLGTVTIDGLPLSQIADDERRRIFGFAPRRPEFLYGTILQNMRFARMDVTEFEIEELLEALGLPLMPELFPEGLQTRLNEVRRRQLGATALQKLNIARTILSQRPVLVFDSVFSYLDAPSRAAVLARLDHRRDEQTVVLVVGHRDLLEACDVTLALNRGAVVAYGPTSEVLPTITQVSNNG